MSIKHSSANSFLHKFGSHLANRYYKCNSIIIKWRHRMEKNFSSIRAFVDLGGKTKYCVSCGNTATQEAIFTVEGATMIEKYCDSCAKKEIK
jgi:hypothetical protein